MKVNQLIKLLEVPLSNVDHVGDFSKNSSFRHARDRAIVTHPASIQNMKKKFGNVKQDINAIFVNTPKGNKVTELGGVDREQVKKYLGDEVFEKINRIHNDNTITVIFTNNKGEQRFSMTPWIMAHRMMHAFARKDGSPISDGFYKDAANEIIHFLRDLLEYYNVKDMPQNYDRMSFSSFDRDKLRNKQLIMKNFFQEVATFKSARDKKIRDWFEVINELGAQYIITGKVEFKDPPTSFKANRQTYSMDQNDRIVYSEIENYLDAMAGYFESKMEKMLTAYTGKIFIM